MQIGELSSREVYIVRRNEPLAEAAKEMRNRHVGCVVVVQEQGSILTPVGIVTDRDIVCGQLRRSADLFCLTVGDVMSVNPLTLAQTATLADAIRSLCARGVRRAPVVDERGDLVGVVSIDDLLPAIAEEVTALAKLVGTQARRERAA